MSNRLQTGFVIKRAAIDVAAGATTSIVAAVAGCELHVLGLVLCANTDGTVQVIDSSPADLSGDMPLGEDSPLVLPISEIAHYVAAKGKSLQLSTVTCTVDGHVVYAEVKA